jgi:hypothetical protein
VREVARFADVYEPEVAASFLAAHDIHAVVAERTHATMNPVLQTALGGVRLLTASDDAQAASDLLTRVRRGEFAEASAERPEKTTARLFPVITVLAALMVGNGYTGRPMSDGAGRISGLHLAGLILLSVALVLWALLLLHQLFGLF